MIARRHELLGADDPATLAAVFRAGKLTAGRTAISKAQVVIAPRNGVGVADMARSHTRCDIGRSCGLRPDYTINSHILVHLAQKPLQDLDRVSAGIDIHVE